MALLLVIAANAERFLGMVLARQQGRFRSAHLGRIDH